jgi:hypothetical protein
MKAVAKGHDIWPTEFEEPITTVAREFAVYGLDLMGVQEVRWEEGALYEQRVIVFSMDKEMRIVNQGQNFLYTKNSISS